MIQHFTRAKNLIQQSQTILLTTHERTDGDDLGTVLALAHELRHHGKNIHVAIRGGVPYNLMFLPASDLVTEEIPHSNFDLLIVSGCGHRNRIGNPSIIELAVPTINFDHHPDNTNFGDVNVVDASKSAVAELAYDFFNAVGYKITHEIATCLLTGIFTDTGSFMHSNTKPSTLKAAADLMRRGANVSRIAKHTYRGKDAEVLRAWSKAFANTRLEPTQQMIYSILTERDLAELGHPPASAFEGFVETLNKVPEAKFALFLKQDGSVIKGSLRSDPHKNINVGELARTLGGGGHMWAAGFSIPGKLVKNERGLWQVEEVES